MFKVCVLVHALLFRTLGKQELNVQSCLGTVFLGSGCCESKQCLSAVNCKGDTLPEIILVEFLENLMAHAIGFLQMNIIWLWYNIAERLCSLWHTKINGNKV